MAFTRSPFLTMHGGIRGSACALYTPEQRVVHCFCTRCVHNLLDKNVNVSAVSSFIHLF